MKKIIATIVILINLTETLCAASKCDTEEKGLEQNIQAVMNKPNQPFEQEITLPKGVYGDTFKIKSMLNADKTTIAVKAGPYHMVFNVSELAPGDPNAATGMARDIMTKILVAGHEDFIAGMRDYFGDNSSELEELDIVSLKTMERLLLISNSTVIGQLTNKINGLIKTAPQKREEIHALRQERVGEFQNAVKTLDEVALRGLGDDFPTIRKLLGVLTNPNMPWPEEIKSKLEPLLETVIQLDNYATALDKTVVTQLILYRKIQKLDSLLNDTTNTSQRLMALIINARATKFLRPRTVILGAEIDTGFSTSKDLEALLHGLDISHGKDKTDIVEAKRAAEIRKLIDDMKKLEQKMELIERGLNGTGRYGAVFTKFYAASDELNVLAVEYEKKRNALLRDPKPAPAVELALLREELEEKVRKKLEIQERLMEDTKGDPEYTTSPAELAAKLRKSKDPFWRRMAKELHGCLGTFSMLGGLRTLTWTKAIIAMGMKVHGFEESHPVEWNRVFSLNAGARCPQRRAEAEEKAYSGYCKEKYNCSNLDCGNDDPCKIFYCDRDRQSVLSEYGVNLIPELITTGLTTVWVTKASVGSKAAASLATRYVDSVKVSIIRSTQIAVALDSFFLSLGYAKSEKFKKNVEDTWAKNRTVGPFIDPDGVVDLKLSPWLMSREQEDYWGPLINHQIEKDIWLSLLYTPVTTLLAVGVDFASVYAYCKMPVAENAVWNHTTRFASMALLQGMLFYGTRDYINKKGSEMRKKQLGN